MRIKRDDLLLAILREAYPAYLEPVQLQKAVFLAQMELGKKATTDILQNPYEFKPYDYGPYCKEVYEDARDLDELGIADVKQSETATSKFHIYGLTITGKTRADGVSDRLPDDVRKYLSKLVPWVKKQTFSSLVSNVYKSYPDMRVNSVFKGK